MKLIMHFKIFIESLTIQICISLPQIQIFFTSEAFCRSELDCQFYQSYTF